MTNTNIQLKPTNHSYYCSDVNYYVPIKDAKKNTFESWDEFKNIWLGCDIEELDMDYNLLFRFDLVKQDEESDGKGIMLQLFFISQRKGNFVPVIIENIIEENMSEINILLNKAYKHLISNVWPEHTLNLKGSADD